MHITLDLDLPRDEASIPVVRHICASVLEEVCTRPDTVSDLKVALTEACANVVEHSGPGDEYRVEIVIDDAECVIRVIDNGHGFGAEAHGDEAPLDLTAEGGRGMQLMRTLVDKVRFESKLHEGTSVCLEKHLFFDGANALTR